MEIWASNLVAALNVAIQAQEIIERNRFGENYVKGSALFCGWKKLRQAIENREPITIKYDDNEPHGVFVVSL